MDPIRRSVLGFVAGSLASATATGFTQPAPKQVVICSLPSDAADPIGPARKAWAADFAKLGLIDGKDIEISIVRARSVDFWTRGSEYEALARKVVGTRPDVIMLHSVWLHHFMPLTRETPIVFMGMLDPEHHGSIASPGRPGGNVTGARLPFYELQEKRLQFLKEIHPAARRAAVVFHPGPYDARTEEAIRASASRLGMTGEAIPIKDPTPPDVVRNALRDARIDVADFLWNHKAMHRDVLGQLVESRIAASFGGSGDVRAGALLSYEAIGLEELGVELAARILRGEPVATMPAPQAREFHLAINLRTAEALGMRVPQSVLLLAQEVVTTETSRK